MPRKAEANRGIVTGPHGLGATVLVLQPWGRIDRIIEQFVLVDGLLDHAVVHLTWTSLVSLFVSEVVEEFLCLGADFGGGGDLLAADLDGDVS